MQLSVRELKKCIERIISLIKFSNNKNLELYAYATCRYGKDFDKITNMKCINDYDDEESQLFSERKEQFGKFRENCVGYTK